MKDHKQVRTLTFEGIFADVFKKLLLKNRIDDDALTALVERWAEKNAAPSLRKAVVTNVKKRLAADEFSHKTFITGIQVLGIEKFNLDLHLDYTNPEPDSIAKGTGIDEEGFYHLAHL